MTAVKTYSIKQFTWTSPERTFSADASDLGVRPEDSAFGFISSRPDSTGLALLNPQTGGTMEFYISHVEFNLENEILWWTLTSVVPALRAPREDACTVIIYND